MITKLRRSRVHEFPLDISFRHFLANTIPSSFTSPVIFLLVAAIVPHNYFNLIFCLRCVGKRYVTIVYYKRKIRNKWNTLNLLLFTINTLPEIYTLSDKARFTRAWSPRRRMSRSDCVRKGDITKNIKNWGRRLNM